MTPTTARHDEQPVILRLCFEASQRVAFCLRAEEDQSLVLRISASTDSIQALCRHLTSAGIFPSGVYAGLSQGPSQEEGAPARRVKMSIGLAPAGYKPIPVRATAYWSVVAQRSDCGCAM